MFSPSPARTLPLLATTLILLSPLLGCAKRGNPTPYPTPAETRDGRWAQDIDYLVRNVKKLHKDPFRHASEANFDASHAALLERVPQSSDPDIIVELARMLATLGDAHTKLVYESDKLLQPAPLDVWRFADGYFIYKTAAHQTDLLGAQILAVDDHPVADVVTALGTIIPHENEHLLESRAERYFRFPEVLHAIGIASQPLVMRLLVETRDGQRKTVRFAAVQEPDKLLPIWEVHEREQMLYERHLNDYYSYEYLPDEEVLYVAYNKCKEQEDKPMKGFAKEVLAFVDEHPVRRVILDVRRNGGGNQIIAWPLLKGLARRDINQPGGLVCLIGLNTFSSALNNSIEFRRWTDGVLIGEPTGQKPNHFGEVRTFRLPNSKLMVVYSTNYFTQLREDPLTLEPDVLAASNFEDWWNGHDVAFQTALTYEPNKSAD